MAINALLISLQAKPGQQEALAQLLRNTAPVAREDRDVACWIATRSNRLDFGIFAAFTDASARDHFVRNTFAQKFMAEAGLLLDEGVDIKPVDIVAEKIPAALPAQPDTKGLLLSFKAQPSQIEEVETFLRDCQAVVAGEAETTAWFALRLAPGHYGIFDVFPDSGGRLKHLVGHVARELAKNSLHWLASMPDMEMMDVVAEKLGESATKGTVISN